MRDHAIVSPSFWTGETGRHLRRHPDAQRLALYLITCPNSNMIGLYYLPIPTICHELGINREGALKALRRASEAPSDPLRRGQEAPGRGFCAYDEASEMVFVYEMARFQIGERLSKNDNRVKAVERMLSQYSKSLFFRQFYEIYAERFSLTPPASLEPLRSPFEAPSKPLRSQDQDQDQDQGIKTGVVAEPTSPRRAAPRKPSSTPHGQAVDHFVEGWSAKYGERYLFNGARDGAIVKRILAHLDQDLDRFRRLVDAYLADDSDGFIVEHRHKLALLQNDVHRWLVAPVATRPSAAAPRLSSSDERVMSMYAAVVAGREDDGEPAGEIEGG